ncbi:hypothetical protein ABIE26_000349 [Pedobacter africanus]|uniref:Uncharacterized protein n=1 Tax=Pedobacter africanus TaxID=151894 RepID=A0ACC6KUW5_9SPHI|nr:SusD/RagB family nutrient-binding outer membrane lipoprotein [Pedobacter africanus]MDR6783163.1 hypothetical protein [Pedobacter africanus]
MKTLYRYILLIVVTSVFLQSCKKFENINTNPNSPTKTTASLLATNLILNITRAGGDKGFILSALTNKQMAWGELPQGEQYNNFGSASFGGLPVLTNVQKMIDAAAETDKNAYTGLGLFIKAYKLYYLSLSVGDIPYAEALSAETGNVTPKYDTQKQVMQQVLKDLENSAAAFAAGKNFSGDPLLNGNVDTWRRIVNSFRLKVLISLSKKESDGDLKIKENFAKILQAEPLLRSNSDNLQLVYSDKANQLYPFNNSINKFTSYSMVSSVMIDTMKKYGDYRLFYFAAPAVYKTQTEGKLSSDWDAYMGTDPSIEFTAVVALFNAKKYSQLNLRYTAYAPGEPLVRIGYAEQNLIIAEAIVRGWAAGSAKTYYEEGIRASMNFVNNTTPDDTRYHSGRKITATYITDTYLQNVNVSFAAEQTRQLKQIWMQKYLLYFMQYPYDAYYDYRRTGYPNLPVNPATSTNPFDKTRIPVRYTYPSEEYNYNLENLKAALDRQYKGNDRTDDLMWILQ